MLGHLPDAFVEKAKHTKSACAAYYTLNHILDRFGSCSGFGAQSDLALLALDTLKARSAINARSITPATELSEAVDQFDRSEAEQLSNTIAFAPEFGWDALVTAKPERQLLLLSHDDRLEIHRGFGGGRLSGS